MAMSYLDVIYFSGYRGGPRGYRGGPRGGRGGRGGHKDSLLKIEGDFDFEASNAKFNKDDIEEELKKKLTISKYCFCLLVCLTL